MHNCLDSWAYLNFQKFVFTLSGRLGHRMVLTSDQSSNGYISRTKTFWELVRLPLAIPIKTIDSHARDIVRNIFNFFQNVHFSHPERVNLTFYLNGHHNLDHECSISFHCGKPSYLVKRFQRNHWYATYNHSPRYRYGKVSISRTAFYHSLFFEVRTLFPNQYGSSVL